MAVSPLPSGDAKRVAVRQMFDRIAPRYDLLNRLMTGGLDRRWRELTLDEVGVAPGDVLLDVACGTGDLSEMAARRGARVLGIDFAGEMLRGAHARQVDAGLVRCDAAALPVADASVTAAVSGFALRNFVSIPEVLAELGRVLVDGGRIGLLEVDTPDAALVRAGHAFYFDRVVPRIGAWLSDPDAYAYLPQSVAYLPPAPELERWIASAGFERVRKRRMLLGGVQLWTAVRAKREGAS